MEICSEGHEDIVHNDRRHNCPLCQALEDIKDLNRELELAQEKIDCMEEK